MEQPSNFFYRQENPNQPKLKLETAFNRVDLSTKLGKVEPKASSTPPTYTPGI